METSIYKRRSFYVILISCLIVIIVGGVAAAKAYGINTKGITPSVYKDSTNAYNILKAAAEDDRKLTHKETYELDNYGKKYEKYFRNEMDKAGDNHKKRTRIFKDSKVIMEVKLAYLDYSTYKDDIFKNDEAYVNKSYRAFRNDMDNVAKDLGADRIK